jgi:microsomal dipeptidase-like Zn-dependent dipeptidase
MTGRPRLLLLLGPAVLAGCLPGTIVERFTNRIGAAAPPPASAAALALHRTSVVVDLHADSLLWGRDLTRRAHVGHVDLPRLRDGGVALQVFGIVTRFPMVASLERTDPRWPDAITLLALAGGWPWRTLGDLEQRALHQAHALVSLAAASEGRFVLIRTRQDLDWLLERRARGDDVIGGLLAIEGAHALGDAPGKVEALDHAGVRMIGLTHFFDDAFAGSAHGIVKGGLTDRGRQLVQEMERRGIVVDLAHASAASITDVLAIATRPPVVSHTGVRATCDNPRNLSDDQLRAIAARGGLIGIGVWRTAVCGVEPADVARAIVHAVRVAGPEHVALGSDFDGGVTTAYDASGWPSLTHALLDAGLDHQVIRQVLGANAVRLLRSVMPDEQGPHTTVDGERRTHGHT